MANSNILFYTPLLEYVVPWHSSDTHVSQFGFSLNLSSAAYTILYNIEMSIGLNCFLRENWIILFSFLRSFLNFE